MSSIPGISYIIALKNAKKDDTYLTYDCVLCNDSKEILEGSVMKAHLRTREHILNVMEMEDYALYAKYKNDINVSTSVLLNKVCSLKPVSTKRIVATLENHEAKRKMLAMNISHLKKENSEKFYSQHSDSVDENKRYITELKNNDSTPITLKETISDADVNAPVSLGIDDLTQRLAGKQNLRYPKQLVFIVDNKNIHIQTEKLGNSVRVIRVFKLTFDSAVAYLDKHEVFNKDSLIIFCCGISSVLTANTINICKKIKCSNQLIRYSVNADVSSNALISKALKLQEDILNKTSNDQVMFCEIVPFIITDEMRHCSNNHTFQNNISDDLFANYLKTIEEYNRFVKYHSRVMGFNNCLDLLTISFPSKVVSYSVNCFSNLGEIDKKNVSDNITDFLMELLKKTNPGRDNLSKGFIAKSINIENIQQILVHSEDACQSFSENSCINKETEILSVQKDNSYSDNIDIVRCRSNEVFSMKIDDKVINVCNQENFLEETLIPESKSDTTSKLEPELIIIDDDETTNKPNIDEFLQHHNIDSSEKATSDNINSISVSQLRIGGQEQTLNTKPFTRSDEQENAEFEITETSIGEVPNAHEISNSSDSKDAIVTGSHSLQGIANIQKERCPNQIVFALDGRDFYVDTKQLGKRVKVVRTMKLTFDNAVSFLEKHELLGKGSLIIFCCGIFSVLVANVLNICKKKKCSNYLMRYSVNQDISGDILISKALKLQEYILSNTSNDQVMFCELVPINISNETKKCDNNHTYQNIIPENIFTTYLKTIEEFNKFVKEYSFLMGFNNFDILKNSFPTTQEVPLSFACRNDIEDLDKEHLSNYIYSYTKGILQNIECRCNDNPKLKEFHKLQHFVDETTIREPGTLYNLCSYTEKTSHGSAVSLSELYNTNVLENNNSLVEENITFTKKNIKELRPMMNDGEKNSYIIDKTRTLNLNVCPEEEHKSLDAFIVEDNLSKEILGEDRITNIETKNVVDINLVHSTNDQTDDVITLPQDNDKPMEINDSFISAFSKNRKNQTNIDIEIKRDNKNVTNIHQKILKTSTDKFDIELVASVSTLYRPLLDVPSSVHIETFSEKFSGEKTFKKAVFLTHPRYVQYMDKFRLPWVEVIAVNTNGDGIMSFIKKKMQTEPSNILWLTHSGIFNISRIKTSDTCIYPPCLRPLEILLPFDENLIEFEDFLIDIHHYYASLMEEVNSILDESSSFLILPPLPPTFLLMEMEKHFIYHEIENKFFYFSTYKAFQQLQILFTLLSKELTMLTISKLEKTAIPRKAIVDYFTLSKKNSFKSSLTCENYSDFSKVSLNPHLQGWYRTTLNFINRCVNVKDTCISDDILVENAGHFVSQTKKNIPYVYDHIIFIGVQEQLDLLPKNDSNSKYISIVETKNQFDWNAIKIKLDSIESLISCKKILVAILGNIKILGNFSLELFCDRSKCKNSLAVLRLDLRTTTTKSRVIKRKMGLIKTVLIRIRNYYKERSTVVLFPLIPINCVEMKRTSSHHDKMHELNVASDFPCLMTGNRRLWNIMAHSFNLKWRSEMFKSLNSCERLKELIVQNFPQHVFPIKWWNITDPKSREFRDSEDFLLRRCKFFFRYFIRKTLSLASSQYTSNPETFFGSFILEDNIPSREKSLDMDGLTYNKELERWWQLKQDSDPQTNDYREENLDNYISQFVKDISNFRKINTKTFNYVYVIGKKELGTMLNKEFENVQHITYEFSKASNQDISTIEKMLGNIPTNSACFVVFELPVISQPILASPGCSKFGCEKFIPVFNLSFENVENSCDSDSVKAFVIKKVAELKLFVTRLTAILPVIVLPFYPSRIYCDDFSNAKHKLSHQIPKSDSFIVIGNQELWEMYEREVINIWIIFLQKCYEKYFYSDKIIDYIKKYSKFLIIDSSLKKFSSCSEIFIWKSIFRALLDSLVLKETSVEEMQEAEDYNRVESSCNNVRQPPPLQNQSLKGSDIIMDVETISASSSIGFQSPSSLKSRSVSPSKASDVISRRENSLSQSIKSRSRYNTKRTRSNESQRSSSRVCDSSITSELWYRRSRSRSTESSCSNESQRLGSRDCDRIPSEPWYKRSRSRSKTRRTCANESQRSSSSDCDKFPSEPWYKRSRSRSTQSPNESRKRSHNSRSRSNRWHSSSRSRDRDRRSKSKSWTRSRSRSRSESTQRLNKITNVKNSNLESIPATLSKKRNRSPSLTKNEAKRSRVIRSCTPEVKIFNTSFHSKHNLNHDAESLTDLNLQAAQSSQPEPIMLMLGQKLFDEFNKERQKLSLIHNKEYEVYRQSPEIHCNHEIYYWKFCSKLQEEIASQRNIERSVEELLKCYLNEIIDIIEKQDWGYKVELLLSNYKLKSKILDSHNQDPTTPLTDFGDQCEVSRTDNNTIVSSLPGTVSTYSSNLVSTESLSLSLTKDPLFAKLYTSSKSNYYFPSTSKESYLNPLSSKIKDSYSSYEAFETSQSFISKMSELSPSSKSTSGSSFLKTSGLYPLSSKDNFSFSSALDVIPSTSFNLLTNPSTISQSLDLQNQNDTHSDEFTIEGTLNLLEQVSSKLGVLGQAMIALSKSAKELGPDSTEAFSLFTDRENIVLLNLVVNKLERLIKCSSQTEVSLLFKTLNWIVQLIDYTKETSKPKIKLNLDALAIACLNKKASYTLNLIKKAFMLEGKTNPEKEEINEVYLKICSLHFDAVQQQPQQ